MAKKRGFFGSLGALFRVAIVVLAGVLVYAIWQNFNAEPDTVAVAPVPLPAELNEVEQAPVAEVEDVAQDVIEEAATKIEETAEVVTEQIEGATESVQDGAAVVAETVEEMASEAEAAVSAATEMASGARESAEEAAATLAEDAENAADEVKEKANSALNTLLKPDGDAASSIAAIKVPGDDTVYAMIETTRLEDGSIEVISQKTGEEMTMTLSRVTCAPLALGVMAAGATPEALETRAEPDMALLVLGTPEAALAAYACGAVK